MYRASSACPGSPIDHKKDHTALTGGTGHRVVRDWPERGDRQVRLGMEGRLAGIERP